MSLDIVGLDKQELWDRLGFASSVYCGRIVLRKGNECFIHSSLDLIESVDCLAGCKGLGRYIKHMVERIFCSGGMSICMVHRIEDRIRTPDSSVWSTWAGVKHIEVIVSNDWIRDHAISMHHGSPNPDSVVALSRLASYMEASHEFFKENFYGVFESEAEAERFALNAETPLWALVVVRTLSILERLSLLIIKSTTLISFASRAV